MVHIYVAHDDDGLVVRAVPLLIIVGQLLTLKVIHDGHQSDGQSFAVFRAGVHLRKAACLHALLRSLAHAPLVVHDVSLLDDFVFFEQQPVRPVLQDEQAGVDGRSALRGHVAHAVDGLVDAGVGIQVTAELHAERACEVDDAVAGEVLRAVEGHVLEEVGQSALVFLLLNGAHALCDVEVSHVLRVLVVADVVRQSVVKFADAHLIVNGNGWHLHVLSHHSHGAEECQHGGDEESFCFHKKRFCSFKQPQR